MAQNKIKNKYKNGTCWQMKWGKHITIVSHILRCFVFSSLLHISRSLRTNQYSFVHRCTDIYILSYVLAALPMAKHTLPSCSVYIFFLLFFLTSLTHFCPSPFGRLSSCTRCSLTDLLSTTSALHRFGQLFFPDKTSRYIPLAFSFPLFCYPFLFWLFFKIIIVQGA